MKPSARHTAVVIARVGKALTSGPPTARSVEAVPPERGSDPVATTTRGTPTASSSGGWTSGTNSESRRDQAVARMQPPAKQAVNATPSSPDSTRSIATPATVKTPPSSSVPHQRSPRSDRTTERSPGPTGPVPSASSRALVTPPTLAVGP